LSVLPPDWARYLTLDEARALRETEEWVHAPQGLLGRALALASRPLDAAYQAVPAGLREALGEAIYKVLNGLLEGSRYTVNPRALWDRLSADVGHDVSSFQQVFKLDLAVLDRAAQDSLRAHRAAAAVEGGATGFMGLVGLVADVPALYGLLFRTIQEISIYYGFPVDSAAEKSHILKVLDVGHYLEDSSRRQGMLELASIQEMIHQGVPLKDAERLFLAKGLQQLARELALDLTRRKLGQTLAVVGSVVGAGMNYQLVTDVGQTAYHAYRRRHLMHLALARMAAREGRR
jgi:hypothetical protein